MAPARSLLAALARDAAAGPPGSGGGAAEHAGLSLHGQNAARRQAITELLFFASVGDLLRCQRICDAWKIDPMDASCCDYDKRTPL